MNFISEDQRTINLPISLGSKVYRIVTSCNDACMFQRDKFSEVFPPKEDGRCSQDMPCHTKLHSIQSTIINLSNLGYVLDNWQIKIFETETKAREAGENLIESHKQQLLQLGLKIK